VKYVMVFDFFVRGAIVLGQLKGVSVCLTLCIRLSAANSLLAPILRST